jgi:hypothetical protein
MEMFDEIHVSSFEMVVFEACLFFTRNTSKRGMENMQFILENRIYPLYEKTRSNPIERMVYSKLLQPTTKKK